MLTPTPAVPQSLLAFPAGALSIWVLCLEHTTEACSPKPRPHASINQMALTSHTDPCSGPLCVEGSHLCGPASCDRFEMHSAAEALADLGASSFHPCHPPPAVRQPVRLLVRLSKFCHANVAQLSAFPIYALTLNKCMQYEHSWLPISSELPDAKAQSLRLCHRDALHSALLCAGFTHVATDNRGKGLTLACREPWRRSDLVGLSRARFSRSAERCRLRPSSPRHSIFSLARSLLSSLACSTLGDSLCL